MKSILLVVFLIIFPFCKLLAANIGTISVVSISGADGYWGTETPLQIIFVANTSFNESTNCVLQCSLNGGKTWRTIVQYENSLTKNCTLQVQYADMLPSATDNNYFDCMGKDIYFRIIQGNDNTTNMVSAKFVCKPKCSHLIYRTNKDTDSSFHICIIPENFQGLDWTDKFELFCDTKNFPLKKKNSGIYVVEVTNKDNFIISEKEYFSCRIQAINIPDANLKEKIQPDTFTINVATDLPAIPTEGATVAYKTPSLTSGATSLSEQYLAENVEPYVNYYITDSLFRGPYSLYKGEKQISTGIKLAKTDSIKSSKGNEGIIGINNVTTYKSRINSLIAASETYGNSPWWKWQAYYQEQYNKWREEWVRFC